MQEFLVRTQKLRLVNVAHTNRSHVICTSVFLKKDREGTFDSRLSLGCD
jgi:hypothetical protein